MTGDWGNDGEDGEGEGFGEFEVFRYLNFLFSFGNIRSVMML